MNNEKSIEERISQIENMIEELQKDIQSIDEDVVDEQRWRQKVNKRVKNYTEECKEKGNQNEKYRFVLVDGDDVNKEYVCKYLPENIQEFISQKFSSSNPAESLMTRKCRLRLILEDADFMRDIVIEKGIFYCMGCMLSFFYENESEYKPIFLGIIDFKDVFETEGYTEFVEVARWSRDSGGR